MMRIPDGDAAHSALLLGNFYDLPIFVNGEARARDEHNCLGQRLLGAPDTIEQVVVFNCVDWCECLIFLDYF